MHLICHKVNIQSLRPLELANIYAPALHYVNYSKAIHKHTSKLI